MGNDNQADPSGASAGDSGKSEKVIQNSGHADTIKIIKASLRS